MKQRIRVAARPNTPKNLSRNHYTTLGFGRVFPVYCEEIPNGSKISLKAENFSRVAPQFLPNLGTIRMKMHAFYVPFNLVWNHFNNFQTGLPSWNNKGSQVFKFVPTLCDADFTSMFTNFSYKLAYPSTVNNFDFLVEQGDSTTNYYKFLPKGKYFYHILCSLGINFNFISWSRFADDDDFKEFNNPYSLLPLLSFFKAYLDYFIPSQLQPSSHLNHLFQKLHELTAVDVHALYFCLSSVDNLRQDLCVDILEFVNELYFYYQNNYFTSAWMSPNEVVPGLNNIANSPSDAVVINSRHSQLMAQVNNGIASSHFSQNLQQDENGVLRSLPTSSITTVNGAVTAISNQRLSADGLTMLQKFARFVRRSNFVGSRAVERLLGTFGIRITDFEAGMSTYLGSDSLVLQQTDITVTGSNQEAGDMAGKGWFASKDSRIFKCNADQYGFLFVTACLETPSMFVDGVRRRNRHVRPLDFYNPDFDGTTMQAIAGDEIFARNIYLTSTNRNELSNTNLSANSTFGYQLRYNEFKNSIDDLSGDFTIPSLRGNIDAFILPRRLYDYIGYDERIHTEGNQNEGAFDTNGYSEDIQNLQEVNPITLLKADDAVQFNRIFKDTTGFADPVFSVFKFDVVVNNCVIPLDTSAELDGKGKELEFESNGVHV